MGRKLEDRLGKNQQLHLKEIPDLDGFLFLSTIADQHELEEAGFAVDEIIERDPHPLEVEHQGRGVHFRPKS